jgi:hypothetical protein
VTLRAALLLAAVAVALAAGAVSVRRVGEQIAVLEACDAADAGNWAAALAGTEGRVGPDATGRAAAECRCRALLASGRGSACTDLMDALLAQPEADDWAPSPALSVHLVQTRRDAGRAREAAELARRAARAHPEDPDLFYLELVTRSAWEDEASVLDELAVRVAPHGPQAVRMRVSLANRHLLRGDPTRALEVLGHLPPRGAGEARALWFETRGLAFASAGDLDGVERSFADWRAVGGDEQEIFARYALTLSLGKLERPDAPTQELLARALEAELEDPKLEEALNVRLVLALVNSDRTDEALAVYDRARRRFALEGLSRAEIERSSAHRRMTATASERGHGHLRFAVGSPQPGARLWLAPPPGAPLDADWTALAVPPSGRLEVQRRVDVAPTRWVLRDAAQRTLASGAVSPAPGADVDVPVVPGPARAPQHVALVRRPGDGRRRVAVVLLDCADWRIVQYLRARGELPVLTALLQSGHRAVLDSDPPLTAAALESLVWPRRGDSPSFLGLVHRFGVELAGLSSVGDNPLGALGWLLPESPDLFSTVGAGELTAANLLFSHGGVQAGRHGVVTGPQGRRQRVPVGTSARDLSVEERARFPALAALRRERDAIHLRTIAAELDAAGTLLREQEIDLLALRIEPLDILTHAHFASTVGDAQDDGRGLLFSVYRYIDARLGEIHAALDEDDVLVVMSDHGIRTSMEHSRFAFFVAAGAGVPHGRTPGTPKLRGVSRALADLLGVGTDWPDTGVAPWIRGLAAARPLARPAPTPHPGPSSP